MKNGLFYKRLFPLVAVFTAIAMLSGACAPQETSSSKGSSSNSTTLAGSTFTWWFPLFWQGRTMKYSNNDIFKEVQKRLDITIEFIHPTYMDEGTQLALLLSSNELPDLITTSWAKNALYAEGLRKYADDGFIIDISELAEKNAPDFWSALHSLPEMSLKSAFTDDGRLFQVCAISPYEEYPHMGLLWRKDFLEQLNMGIPKTISQMETVLRACKNKLGCSAPLLLHEAGVDYNNGTIVSAWNIGPSYYIDPDTKTVEFGPVQPEFKEYLTLMNRWYKDGLIDPDFVTNGNPDVMFRLLGSGESAAVVESNETVNNQMARVGRMIAGYQPMLTENQKPRYRMYNTQYNGYFATSITSGCENPALALQFLNFGYTKEGYMLYNFGMEGSNYTIDTSQPFSTHPEALPYVDGKVLYTAQMMNNLDYPLMDAMLKFKVHIGPFIRFEDEGNPIITEELLANKKFWAENASIELTLPPVSLTAEEEKKVTAINSRLNDYYITLNQEFIMGITPLTEYDKYVSTVKNLGLQEALDIYRAAYARYIAR